MQRESAWLGWKLADAEIPDNSSLMWKPPPQGLCWRLGPPRPRSQPRKVCKLIQTSCSLGDRQSKGPLEDGDENSQTCPRPACSARPQMAAGAFPEWTRTRKKHGEERGGSSCRRSSGVTTWLRSQGHVLGRPWEGLGERLLRPCEAQPSSSTDPSSRRSSTVGVGERCDPRPGEPMTHTRRVQILALPPRII